MQQREKDATLFWVVFGLTIIGFIILTIITK